MPEPAPQSSHGARARIRAAFGRDPSAEDHGVQIVDTPEVRIHHPSDLLGIVLSALGIAVALLVAVFAHGTTAGVTEDVQGISTWLQRIFVVPVTVLEGLLTVFVPVAVLGELGLRRLGRQVLETLAAGALGLLAAAIAYWLTLGFGSPTLVAALSLWVGGEWTVVLPAYLAVLVAMITAAGPRARRRSIAWSWNFTWVTVAVLLITAQVSVPGVITVVLLGRMAGLAVRYVSGVQSERAYGPALVRGIRSAGFDPVRLVRITGVSDEDTSDAPTEASDASSDALTRNADNRVYAMTTSAGLRFDVVVVDGDRQVIGALTLLWRSLRLRGIDGRAVVSLRPAAERAALLSYAATAAGVRTPRLLAVAESEDSMLLVQEHVQAVPLSDLTPEDISDDDLAAVWEQLATAHAAGLAHRALTADAVLLGTPLPGDLIARRPAWLTSWGSGDVASSSLARRLDRAQMLALLALHVGPQRALGSAARALSPDELAAVGPLIQSVALPRSTREGVRAEKTLLSDLRTALVHEVPDAVVEPERLVRFGARKVVTIGLLIVAAAVVVTSMNFGLIVDALRTASPWWTAAAFALGLTTWIGAAMTLIAFSPIALPPWRALLTQVAGSFVAIAAPAGVGPAALNLRLLTRRGVSASLSTATVALVQVSQFVVTVAILIVLSLFTGDAGALRQMPSSTVLIAVGLVVAALVAVMLVPAVRRWVLAKSMPMLRQTWPRLSEVISQPGRLALAFFGNLVMTMGYIFAFEASMAAFNVSMSLIDIAVIYLLGNAAGAAVPTPGGLGTVELALTGGLTGAGVPPALAASAVVLFRALTYWLRIPLGWLAMRSLQRTGEL